jgi:hypothetical protein
MLEYRRTGGRQPSDFEVLRVGDDGAFTLWRTIAVASNPPTPIGRFAGSLSEDEAGPLRDAAAGVRGHNLQLELPPGSAVERIATAGAVGTIPHSAEPDGAWGVLVAQCRGLLTALTDRPQAALALEVAPDGGLARLVHRGQQPLSVDPESLKVHAVLWEGYEQRGDWRWQASQEPAEVEAGPGWSLDLPFDHGLTTTATAELGVTVEVQVFAGEDEGWLVCVLETPHPAMR